MIVSAMRNSCVARAQNPDEQARQEAEHQWEHPLDRQRSGESVRPFAATLAQVVGLPAEHHRDAGSQLLGLNQRRNEDRHRGNLQPSRKTPQSLNSRTAGDQIRLKTAKFGGQCPIGKPTLQDPGQGRVESETRFAERGQEFQRERQVPLELFDSFAPPPLHDSDRNQEQQSERQPRRK